MSDEPIADHQVPLRVLSQTHHVITAHAPKPTRRVIVPPAPPRTVVYDGREFEVMYDGRDPGVVVEEPR